MPGVLKSLKIRAQALSPSAHTYVQYSEEPSLQRLNCTVVKTGQRRQAPPPPCLIPFNSFIHAYISSTFLHIIQIPQAYVSSTSLHLIHKPISHPHSHISSTSLHHIHKPKSRPQALNRVIFLIFYVYTLFNTASSAALQIPLVSEDAGIEPRTVALAVRRSSHSPLALAISITSLYFIHKPIFHPQAYISSTSLILIPQAYISSTFLHIIHIPQAYISSTFRHLIHKPTSHPQTYISSTFLHLIHKPTSHPQAYISHSHISSTSLHLIHKPTSNPKAYI